MDNNIKMVKKLEKLGDYYVNLEMFQVGGDVVIVGRHEERLCCTAA